MILVVITPVLRQNHFRRENSKIAMLLGIYLVIFEFVIVSKKTRLCFPLVLCATRIENKIKFPLASCKKYRNLEFHQFYFRIFLLNLILPSSFIYFSTIIFSDYFFRYHNKLVFPASSRISLSLFLSLSVFLTS